MINDELLVAYAEGALAPAERMRVEAAAAKDPSIARRLMDHVGRRRRTAMTHPPRAFQRQPSGLAPRRPPLEGTSAIIVDLATIRAERSSGRSAPRPAQEWRTLLSPAAATTFVGVSLVAGLLIGAFLTTRPPPPQVVIHDGGLFADGALLRALKASQSGRVGAVLVGAEQSAADGRPCRPFRFRAPTGLAGVACRSSHGWRLEMTLADEGAPSPDGLIFPAKVQAALAELTRSPESR